MIFAVLFSVLLAFTVHASPSLLKRQSITALTTAQISSFKPFTFFASAAYCQPSTTLTWTCGANCNVNAGFIPVASGGDGSSVQFWYVGFDTSLNTVIVSHQGTDPSKIVAILTDANIIMKPLDSRLFPGISSSVEVHEGFANDQAKTAPTILAAVEKAMSVHGATHVTIVGHSLGAALALIDSVYLPLHLPTNTAVKTVVYGLPRVGNQAFANYVDAHALLTHINNKEDIVPTIPGRFLGFHHPSGEVHIEDSGEWASCPGQDNTNSQCSTGDVKNIFEGKTSDHNGPYDGVTMGC